MLLCLLLTVLLCSPAFASNVGDSLSIAIQSTKTATLNPLDPQERDMLSIYNVIYESLITLDDDYKPQGLIADSWSTTGAGKTWTFHIRSGVRFSDGTPLTSQDVVATARYILDRANDESTTNHGYYANLKYYISSITADDDEVVIKTKRPCYGLLYAMTFPIVPAAYAGQDYPPGSGPYQVAQFVAGDYMQLEPNPHWWRAQPQVKNIMVSFHETQKKVIDEYEFARVDTVFTRSIAASQFKTGTTSLSMPSRTNQLDCLLMNNSSPELTKDVRMAIRYVVNPSRIVSGVYLGMATLTDTPMYPGTWMYNDGLSSYFVKDTEKAKQLLAKAGWADSNEDGILDRLDSEGKLANLHLRFYVYEEPDDSVREEAANMIVEDLASVGIAATVTKMTLADLTTKLTSGSYDLALVSYAMDVCPDPGFMLMKKNTGNYVRYNSAAMNELCEELRTQVTWDGYRDKLMAIQKQFAEDCPFICLYYRKGMVLTHYMYTTNRDVRENELLRGIESFVS